MRPSLVSLRLVKCGRGAPDAAAEDASSALCDPSMTLREAQLADVSWLVADFAVVGAHACFACMRASRVPLTIFSVRVPARRRKHGTAFPRAG